jgi:hypothetical protein
MNCFPGEADVFCRAANSLTAIAPVIEGDSHIGEVNEGRRLARCQIIGAVLEVWKHGSKGWLSSMGSRFGVRVEQTAGCSGPDTVLELSKGNGAPEGCTGAPEQKRAVLLREFVEGLAGTKTGDFTC